MSTRVTARSAVLIAALGLGTGALAGAQPPEPAPLPSVVLPAALDRVLRDYEQAWQAKDAAKLAGLFAEDGFVLSSGVPPVRGRIAIQAHYTGRVAVALRPSPSPPKAPWATSSAASRGRRGSPTSASSP